jgi:NADH-quinone oxidoreductase subunit E
VAACVPPLFVSHPSTLLTFDFCLLTTNFAPMPFDKDEIVPEVQALFDALDQKKLRELDHAIARWKDRPTALLHVMHVAQETFTWLPEGALERIARGLDLPRAQVYGFATFYDHFYTDGPARNTLRVCHSISCHLRGAPELIAAAKSELKADPGAITKDGRVRFECVSCLGQCDGSPSVSVNDEPHHGVTPDSLRKMIRELK